MMLYGFNISPAAHLNLIFLLYGFTADFFTFFLLASLIGLITITAMPSATAAS
jgi:hypothetical protein